MSNKSAGENPRSRSQQELLKNLSAGQNLKTGDISQETSNVSNIETQIIINGNTGEYFPNILETRTIKAEEKAQPKPKEQKYKVRIKPFQGRLLILGFSACGVLIAIISSGELKGELILILVFILIIIPLYPILVKLINKILHKIEKKFETQEDNLANLVVDSLEIFIVKLFSQFEAKYYQHLIYIYRNYNTQGLQTKGPFTLDLEKVFVPLRVAPESVGNISNALIQSHDNPKGVVLSKPEEGLSIWDFLAASNQPDKYYSYRTIVIIGAPGTGKTTLLENLVLTYANNTQHHKHKQAPKLIPILLYLRDIGKTITSSPQLSLGELLEQHQSISALKPPSNWFGDKLRSNSCLVMLDGLDEVADGEQRRIVSNWLKQQILNYPHARFILTSRPFGYRNAPVEGINTVLEVQPFNLEQMEKFIYNWYLQNEIMSHVGKEDAGIRNTATQKAADLIKAIKNSSPLAAMALNPLLLTMIATVHCYRGALPKKTVELYGEICDVLLGRRREAKGIWDRIRPNQKKVILQVLALGLMQHKTREFTPRLGISLIHKELVSVARSDVTPLAFLEKIKHESALLVERERDKYEFAHKSFQEYLAAVQIKESKQENILIANINNDWWEETIRLYAAISDATNIIRAALAKPSIISLRIAFDCSEEGRCQPEIREQLLQKLDAGLESSDREIFQLAASVKLARRLKGLLRVDEDVQIDQSYITCAEYQLYVDENLNSQQHFQPDCAKKPITDISWENALLFCAWLSRKTLSEGVNKIETQEVYFYRLLTTAEALSHEAKEYKNRECWTVNGTVSANQGIRVVRNKVSPNYAKLVNYLANGEWQKADRETANIMLKIVHGEGEGDLDTWSVEIFPVQELFNIDQLWLVYSGGSFGFSIQASIWENIRGNQNTRFQRLTQTLGWRNHETTMLQLDNIPTGNFPYVWQFNSLQKNRVIAALLEKFIASKLEKTRSPFTFKFDAIAFNKRGQQIKRKPCQARYFTEYLDDGVNLDMVAIPGGTFTMGAPKNEAGSIDSERPQHQVTVGAFFMGKYPVTQAQWEVVAALPQIERELKSQPSHFRGNNLPVESVSWYDAVEFCARLSKYTGLKYRLPSEAQWEYACRAGTTTPFHFGEIIPPNLANYGEKHRKTTPVGQFLSNAFGLCDMHGNVWEWCEDTWHENYNGAPTDGSTWSDNENRYRVLRGGSWYNKLQDSRCANRIVNNPNSDNYTFGLRVVWSIEP